MRRIAARACITTFLFLTIACAQAPAPPPAPAGPTSAELKTAADRLDQDFVAAFNKGDADALMATYWNSPELVSMSPEGSTTGHEATRAATIEMFKSMPGVRLELVTHNNRVEGSAVIGWGTWRMTLPGTPQPQVFEGRFSDVKAMKDGKMVYVIDHASVPLPPPPAPVRK